MCSSDLLIQIFVDILATSPRMTEAIGQKVHVVDGLIDAAFYGGRPAPEEMARRIEVFLGENQGYEDLIDQIGRASGRERA